MGLLDRGGSGNGNVENNDYNCCEYNMEIIEYGELPLAPWQHVPFQKETSVLIFKSFGKLLLR